MDITQPAPRPHQPATRRSDSYTVVLLLLLTAVSGLVDAASYLNFGHVFVANMTGNIVFVGFAIAGAPSLSLRNSIIGVAAFFLGALVGGRLSRSRSIDNATLLRLAAAVELGLVLVAIAVGWGAGPWGDYAIVALLAAAMGLQSALTSRLQVPGFNSTVVLTTMLATMAAASRLAGGSGADNTRRALAISTMLLGALVGAALTLRVARLGPLLLAAACLVAVIAASHAALTLRNGDRGSGRVRSQEDPT